MSGSDVVPQAAKGSSPVTVAPARESTWDRAAAAFVAWRDGEPGAMDELVTTMTPVLWQAVRGYGLSRQQAEDVVQGTWLVLLRRWDAITQPQAVAGWLLTTARRDAWRMARSAAPTVPVTPEVLERADDAASPEESTVTRDQDERLWACVRRLPERCQRLLRIVAFDDRPSYAGIAQDLHMPVGSIGPTRQRCLQKLRDVLLAGGGLS